MSAIIVTGAGGFVGRLLVRRLQARGDVVTGIGRGPAPADWPAGAHWVRADLANAADYQDALAGAACVLHLAAITGKAKPADYTHGNVDATRTLLDACARARIARFVLVSTVAATFADRRFYPYAESKIAAEALVRAAPLTRVIVRPTMILGPGSPIEQSLAKLARLPVSPMFGDGRRLVQPIDVEDVADMLAALAHDANEGVIEIGGPDTYDLRELYARLRAAHGGQGAPRFAHLPLGLIRQMLALVEKPLLALLPLTAGQLATFANDGVAAPHPDAARLLPHPRPAPRPAAADGADGPPGSDALDAEFARHARYVSGAAATPYQSGKYRDFHQRRTLAPANGFDALLLRFSRFGGLGLGLADSYSGLFYRGSVVRAKLVLTLAILESSAPSFSALDAPDPGGRLAYAHMALRGVAAAFGAVFAALLLAPAHIMFGLTGRLKPAQ